MQPSPPSEKFDPDDVWVRAAMETPHLRRILLLERWRKLTTILSLYPQRLPRLLLDKRSVSRWSQGQLACSLGALHADNVHARSQLREVLISGAYASRGFVPASGWNVVDVGANLGFFSLWAASFMRRGSIVSIEAVPETYQLLVRNAAIISHRGIESQCLNVAVADRRRMLEFAIPDGYANYARSTEHLGRLESFAGIATREVQGRPLDEILAGLADAGNSEASIDLLKIDVEGSEVDCIIGAAGTLRRTKRVVLEYHSHELLEESSHRLRKAGFERIAIHPHFLGGGVGIVFWRAR